MSEIASSISLASFQPNTLPAGSERKRSLRVWLDKFRFSHLSLFGFRIVSRFPVSLGVVFFYRLRISIAQQVYANVLFRLPSPGFRIFAFSFQFLILIPPFREFSSTRLPTSFPTLYRFYCLFHTYPALSDIPSWILNLFPTPRHPPASTHKPLRPPRQLWTRSLYLILRLQPPPQLWLHQERRALRLWMLCNTFTIPPLHPHSKCTLLLLKPLQQFNALMPGLQMYSTTCP